MKKTMKAAALAAAILMAASCGSNSNQTTTTTTTAAATTTAAEATTTTAAETTTTTAAETTTTTAAETTTTTVAETTTTTTTEAETTTEAAAETQTEAPSGETEAAGSEKTLAIVGADGNGFYAEDASEIQEEYCMMNFDRAIVRLSSGMYYDSDTNPELFEPDDFVYSGETAGLGNVVSVTAGDTLGDLTVSSASTSLMYYDDTESGQRSYMPFGSTVNFDGTLTVTGIIRYYYDEIYTVASGDIRFIPDSSYAGLPMAVNPSGDEYLFGVRDFDEASTGDEENYFDTKWGGNVCVYSDAQMFCLGNLNTDYSDNTELISLFDGGSANCTKRVQITLGNIYLHWSDQFGPTHCSAEIEDISLL